MVPQYSTAQSVLKHLDLRELILLTQKFVQTPSVSHDEKDLGELVADELDRIGLDVRIVGGNVIASLKNSDSGKTLALCSHLDTVPVTNAESWSLDPYSGRIENGKLWGLGSADMKGGLAAQIMSIRAIKQSGVTLTSNILFVGTVMEETGKERYFARKGILEVIDKGLLKADATVIAEPTKLIVARGHRGICNTVIRTIGKAAHGGVPDEGINAIEKMAKVLLALNAMKLPRHAELGPGTLTTCVIEGGTKLGIVPDKCTALIDRRLTAGESRESVQDEIVKLVQDLKRDDPDLNVEIECPYSYEAVVTDSTIPVVKSLADAVQAATGRHAELGFIPYGTDGAWISKLLNCPVVIYGPGNIANAHRPNEYVDLQEVQESAKAYAILLSKYLS